MWQSHNLSDINRLSYIIESCLFSGFISNNNQIVNNAIEYSLKAGGKRIRPILCLLTVEAIGGDINNALSCAVALEYIHTYSLIHDDLPAMDNDDLRRGKPTCHIVFGEGQAILAGDGLLTEAFGCIASDNNLSSDQIVDIINILSKAAGLRGMIGGQSLDLELSVGNIANHVCRLDEVQQIHELKTGALIRASMEIGAITAKASLELRDVIKNIGGLIGLAFQIKDDLLDITSNDKDMGKRVCKDDKKNKMTYPRILGIKKSEQALMLATKQALDLLSSLPNPTSLIALTNFLAERAV